MLLSRYARFILLLFAVGISTTAFATTEGTPEHALVEILTASRPEAVEKHLPESIRSGIRTLNNEDRLACEQKLLIGKNLQRGGNNLEVPEDGHALLVLQPRDSGIPAELRLEREVTGGGDAVLEVTLNQIGDAARRALIWMRQEDGDWRVTEVQWLGFERKFVIDDPAFVEQFRQPQQKAISSAVVAILRTLQNAIFIYRASYPEVGFPADLSVLGSGNETEADQAEGEETPRSDQHAGLLDNDMAANQLEKDGYIFHYELRSAGSEGTFVMTARPVHYGPTGQIAST